MPVESFLFHTEELERMNLVKVDAYRIWETKHNFEHLDYYENYGIGLADHPDYPDPSIRYNYGFISTGVIDCGPNVSEYGRLVIEQDIFYGVSNITWKVRSSSDRDAWSTWKDSTSKIPVHQYVQFKFELFLTEGEE